VYEKTDIDAFLLWMLSFCIAICGLLLFSGMGRFFKHMKDAYPRTVTKLRPQTQLDLNAYLSSQKLILETYGWVDRPRGTARVPIHRAMEILSHEAR
jgi:hypothetical protein